MSDHRRGRALTTVPSAAATFRREKSFREKRSVQRDLQAAGAGVLPLETPMGVPSPRQQAALAPIPAGTAAASLRASFFGAPPNSALNNASVLNSSLFPQAFGGSFGLHLALPTQSVESPVHGGFQSPPRESPNYPQADAAGVTPVKTLSDGMGRRQMSAMSHALSAEEASALAAQYQNHVARRRQSMRAEAAAAQAAREAQAAGAPTSPHAPKRLPQASEPFADSAPATAEGQLLLGDSGSEDGCSPVRVRAFSQRQRCGLFVVMFLTILFANYDSGAIAALYGHEPPIPSLILDAVLDCPTAWYDFLSLAEGPADYKALAAAETPATSAARPLVGISTRARTQTEAIQEAMGQCVGQNASLGRHCRVIYPQWVPEDLHEVIFEISSPASGTAWVGGLIIADAEVSCTVSSTGTCLSGMTVHGHRSSLFPGNHTRPFRGGSRPVTLSFTHTGTWNTARETAFLKAVAAAVNLPQPDTPGRADIVNSVMAGYVDVETGTGARQKQIRFINVASPRTHAAELVALCSASAACLGTGWTVTGASVESPDWGDLLVSLLHDPDYDRLYGSTAWQGFLSAIVYIGLSLGSIVSGWAFEKYPPRAVLSLSLVVNIAFAWAFAASKSRLQLFFARFLVGMSQATLVAYMPIWVTEFAPKNSQGIWLSLVMAGVPLGIVVGYAAAGAIAQQTTWPWYWAFFIQGFFLAPLVAIISLSPNAWHVSPSPQRPDDEEESDTGEPTVRPRTVTEGLLDLVRNTTLWLTIGSLSSLYFVVNSMQTWVTPYLTDKCTPVSESLGTVVIAFGITAITGPIVGVILGGTSLDCIGGYTGNLERAALLASAYGFVAALAAYAALVVTNFWAFIILVWFTLAFGGAVVPAATGVVLACVDEDLRKLVSSYAAVHYNIWGFNLGPLLVGVVATAAQSESTCPRGLLQACEAIGCAVASAADQGACPNPYGLTWGFRLGMGWSLVACIFMLCAWCACKKMLEENHRKTRLFFVGPNGETIIVFYQIAGVWAWRHETCMVGSKPAETDSRTVRPCCWVEVKLGDMIPSAQLARKTLYIDAQMLPLLPFAADDDLHLADDRRLDSAVCADTVTLEDVSLSDFVHWRLARIISQGGKETANVSNEEDVRRFVQEKTAENETVMIVLQDGHLWDAFVEPMKGVCKNPRCCSSNVRVDLLNTAEGGAFGCAPDEECSGEEVCHQRREALLRILRSHERKRFSPKLLADLQVHLSDSDIPFAVLTLVYTKGIDDPKGRSLKAKYQQACKNQDLDSMQKYLALLKRHHNTDGKKKVLVVSGAAGEVQKHYDVDPDVTASELLLYMDVDADDSTTGGTEPRHELWFGKHRLEPHKKLSDFRIGDGAVLTLRERGWDPGAEAQSNWNITVSQVPTPDRAAVAPAPPAAVKRSNTRKGNISEVDRRRMAEIADREQWTAKNGLHSRRHHNPAEPTTLWSWMGTHFGCCSDPEPTPAPAAATAKTEPHRALPSPG